MPRKPRLPFCTAVEKYSNPRHGSASLCALIDATLIDRDEFAAIEPDVRVGLVNDLEESVRRALVSYSFQRRGVSDKKNTASIFMSDIAASLEKAGIPAKRWRKIDDGSGRESLLFRLSRDLASDAGLKLPTDMKVLSQSSQKWKPGVGTGRLK